MTNNLSQRIKVRPLSPHLSVYKPEYSSSLSIYHRITGVSLSLLLLSLGVIYKLQAYNIELMSNVFSKLSNLDNPMLINSIFWFIIFLVILMLSYHLSNGIRHLIWDSITTFVSKAYVKSTSYIVLLTTLISFVLLFYLILS